MQKITKSKFIANQRTGYDKGDYLVRYIVGDIHGEIIKLKSLIDFISENDKNPEFIFIGDYIDKGENSKEVLIYLQEVEKKFSSIFLIGNHEYYWRDVVKNEAYLLKYGAKKTISSFKTIDLEQTRVIIEQEFGNFLASLQNYCIIDNYFISHSGIAPEFYSETNHSLIPTESFLFNRYSFIKMEALFQNKYTVVFGHTAFYTPYVDDYKIGIDTAACFLTSQPLTAFCIDSKTFYNSDKRTISNNTIDKNKCPNIVRTHKY